MQSGFLFILTSLFTLLLLDMRSLGQFTEYHKCGDYQWKITYGHLKTLSVLTVLKIIRKIKSGLNRIPYSLVKFSERKYLVSLWLEGFLASKKSIHSIRNKFWFKVDCISR